MQSHSALTHYQELDSWHIQLAILQNAFHSIFNCDSFMEEDSRFGDALNILDKRFEQLLDLCPFPTYSPPSDRTCTPAVAAISSYSDFGVLLGSHTVKV